MRAQPLLDQSWRRMAPKLLALALVLFFVTSVVRADDEAAVEGDDLAVPEPPKLREQRHPDPSAADERVIPPGDAAADRKLPRRQRPRRALYSDEQWAALDPRERALVDKIEEFERRRVERGRARVGSRMRRSLAREEGSTVSESHANPNDEAGDAEPELQYERLEQRSALLKEALHEKHLAARKGPAKAGPDASLPDRAHSDDREAAAEVAQEAQGDAPSRNRRPSRSFLDRLASGKMTKKWAEKIRGMYEKRQREDNEARRAAGRPTIPEDAALE